MEIVHCRDMRSWVNVRDIALVLKGFDWGTNM